MWVGVGVVVVVIALIAGGLYWFMHRGGAPAYLPVHAPAGQVVSGFPQELILDAPTGTSSGPGGITNSYSINYSSRANQYTAEWDSSSTPARVYADYGAYATAHQWRITNLVDQESFKGIYAVMASSSINMVVVPNGTGSAVTLTYLAQ